MNETEKVLYFEGAGLSDISISKATIGNCRIRAAFHLDDGQPVYLEIVGAERYRNCNLNIFRWQYTGFVEACYYITDDVPNDDCNKHRIILPDMNECGGLFNPQTFEYTDAAILNYVNKLGASFTSVKVVPSLGGYRVFPNDCFCTGPDAYNYGDEFKFDPDITARREAVRRWVYDLESEELAEDRRTGAEKFVHSPSGYDYPNFLLWVDEKDSGLLHLMRHFNGHNRFWTIRTDIGDGLEDWMATMQEIRYGR